MRRILAVLLALALVGAGVALAERGDPQKRITPADQARAKAMLLRRSDFGIAFRAAPPLPQSGDVYCEALDESDLTLTGEAESPTFQGGVETVSSLSRVYESLADSNASWRRAASTAGERCARAELGEALALQGGTLESFRRIPFPTLTERTTAYRLVVSAQGIRIFMDVVGLKQRRAQVALLLVSALTPMPREEEARLAGVVARRMKAAMRAG